MQYLVWLAALLAAIPSAAAQVKREKQIDFEDTLVEGVNQRPLDSLSQIGDSRGKRRKHHLYRKRAGFRAETQELLSELEHQP
jgi:hypothetical protein